jgi:thiol-disulfide isomerase/thioredoxin
MRTVLVCCVAGLLWLLTGSMISAEDKTTDAKLIKYDQLADLVRQNKGKVVVVDLWTTACIPCIEKFPKMVEMQTKYAADGLVIITVNVDPSITDPAARPVVLAAIQSLLASKKVTLTNRILDETPELAEKNLHFGGAVPSMFVFTREGKWWQFSFDKKDVDDFARLTDLVQEELKKKP